MLKILATFALRHELAPWQRLRHFRPVEAGPLPTFQTTLGNAEVTAVLVGTGARRAGSLLQRLPHMPHLAIVAGVAGGLKAEHQSGDLLVAKHVTGEDTSRSCTSDGALVQAAAAMGAKQVERFLSLPRTLNTPEEKSRFGFLADAVEMESLAVMNELLAYGVPAVAIRAVSDPVNVPLPCDFEKALDEAGEIRASRLLAQMVWPPQKWWRMIEFSINGYRATVKLARFLDRYIPAVSEQKSFERSRARVA